MVLGVVRSFESFAAYADEAGEAQVLGGMHFRNSIQVGQRQGKKVGNWVIDHYLLPLP